MKSDNLSLSIDLGQYNSGNQQWRSWIYNNLELAQQVHSTDRKIHHSRNKSFSEQISSLNAKALITWKNIQFSALTHKFMKESDAMEAWRKPWGTGQRYPDMDGGMAVPGGKTVSCSSARLQYKQDVLCQHSGRPKGMEKQTQAKQDVECSYPAILTAFCSVCASWDIPM